MPQVRVKWKHKIISWYLTLIVNPISTSHQEQEFVVAIIT